MINAVPDGTALMVAGFYGGESLYITFSCFDYTRFERGTHDSAVGGSKKFFDVWSIYPTSY